MKTVNDHDEAFYSSCFFGNSFRTGYQNTVVTVTVEIFTQSKQQRSITQK